MKYSIKYTIDGRINITKASSRSIKDLLKGKLKHSIVETKMTERMPASLHDLIADHNRIIDEKK